MRTAKLFRHGGSQAVRLPKDFRFVGTEVYVQKRGESVILKPKPGPTLKTLQEVARYMREHHPAGSKYPALDRPQAQQARDLNLD